MRLSRAEIFDPAEVVAVHAMARTVRRCFLMGDDSVSGKNFDHRKQWIEEKLQLLAANFGIDLLAFSCMSNHFHLVLRSRPDVVQTWDDSEVALPKPKVKRNVDGQNIWVPVDPNKYDLNSIRNDPAKLADIRRRLSDISWWMRLLCQYIAMRANAEDGEGLGKFWQSRYKAVRILDEETLLACAAYVDLNPIRAELAKTLETSDYASVQRRITSMQQAIETTSSPTEIQFSRADDFPSPIAIGERTSPVGPQPSRNKRRCSDRGFLAMCDADYLTILDWLARNTGAGKRGSTPIAAPEIFERLGIDSVTWSTMAKEFGRSFKNVAGKPTSIAEARSLKTHRKFYSSRVSRASTDRHLRKTNSSKSPSGNRCANS